MTKLSRRSWLAGIAVLLVGFIFSMAVIKPTSPASQTETLSQHYAALLSPDVAAKQAENISRILAVLLLDESVVSASVFTPEGERLAYSGSIDTTAEMVRQAPDLLSVFRPITYSNNTVGYLSVVYRPKSSQ